MKIIAKTQDGCLIQATGGEVREILKSVSGTEPEKLTIGQKIPAIDYAATITKVKALKDDYYTKSLFEHVTEFNDRVDQLKEAIDQAGNIEI